MSDNLTFAELEAQHVELLPARTVLSLFSLGRGGRGDSNPGTGFNWMSPSPVAGIPGGATFGEAHGGAGGTAHHG